MNWGNYLVLKPIEFSTLDKASARATFLGLMELKEFRIGELKTLVDLNGLQLASDTSSFDDLESWLCNAAQLKEGTFQLTEQWQSVCRDIGFYLGDVLISHHPSLTWAFLDISSKYQDRFAPAVIGFGVKDKWYGPAFPLDVERVAISHVAAGVRLPGSFNARLDFYDKLATEHGK
jgi:hypothetical protein